mgnify:CR=1 FL=1|tara:strand:- start:237 stop:407 length:171 start_codon:yes stop_codon:yes gene_type:complete
MERDNKIVTTLVVERDDVKNSIHPNLFDDWCEELNLDPIFTDRFEITVSKVRNFTQ